MSRIGQRAQAAREQLRRAGPRAALGLVFQKVAARLFRYERLDVVVLARETIRPIKSSRPGVTSVRVAERADIEFMHQAGDWWLGEEKIGWLDLGYVCFLSEVDGQIAGYTWAHNLPTATLLDDLVITIPDRFVYNFDGFTHPDFRGYGLQSVRHQGVLDHPQWRGKRGLLGYVAGTNVSSKRGQGKSGYVGVGAIRCARMGGRMRTLFGRSLTAFGVARVPS